MIWDSALDDVLGAAASLERLEIDGSPAIENVEALDFSGRTANFVVRIRGTYYVNSIMFL